MGPQAANAPRTARVGDVRALHGDLQDEGPPLRRGRQRRRRQAPLRTQRAQAVQELSLAGDVRGEDHGAQGAAQAGQVVRGEVVGQARGPQQGEPGAPVVVLQHGGVVVEARQVVVGGHQEPLVHAGVIEVVADGGHQRRHHLQRRERAPQDVLPEEAVHGLGDVGGVHPVVVGVDAVVPVLHLGEELPDCDGGEAEAVQEAVLAEEVRAKGGQVGAAAQAVKGEGVEVPAGGAAKGDSQLPLIEKAEFVRSKNCFTITR